MMKNDNRGRRKATGEANSVTFRLEQDDMLELLERADRLKLSHHLLAREYVFQVLRMEHSLSELFNIYGGFIATIEELRKDIALGVEANLVASGQYTEKEAGDWVKSQFKLGEADETDPRG